MPTGWYLECTTAGTTSSDELVINSPAINSTVSDGTVVWTIFQNGYGLNGFLRGKLHTQNAQARILTNSNSNFLELIAGTSINDASGITIWGINNTDQNGGFRLRAKDSTNRNDLTGYPNGELYWGGRDLAGSAIVAKSISSSGYIKYTSGLIIQWGAITLDTNETSKTKALPVLFSAAFAICGNVNYANGGASVVRAVNINILYTNTIVVQIESAINGVVGIGYIAIGY